MATTTTSTTTSRIAASPSSVAASRLASSSTSVSSYSAAVNRSSELLSCAQSALKIAQQKQHAQPQQHAQRTGALPLLPQELHLAAMHNDMSSSLSSSSSLIAWQEECLSWLRSLQTILQHVQGLVRRSGQSNDPTHELTVQTQRFEQAIQHLKQALHLPQDDNADRKAAAKRRSQVESHQYWIREWCAAVAQHYGQEWQATLKVRAQVLQRQAKRRQQFVTTTSNSSSSTTTTPSSLSRRPLNNTTSASLQRNPLFAATAAPPPSRHSYRPTTTSVGSAPTRTTGYPSSSSSSYYYGGGATNTGGASGYGGISTGMRHRKGGGGGTMSSSMRHMDPDESTVESHHSQANTQVQQQQFQPRASAQRRLHEARQAEQALHSIGTMFGKLSSLVSQQAEVLEKVEDDVEAASVNVQAGHDEITTLHAIKKGNRSLILKVFGMLLFLILFLRLYKK